MKYCTCCEKMRETHIRTTGEKFWWKIDRKLIDPPTEYVREVCIKCQTPLLLAEVPKDTSPIKISKKDKRREKIYNRDRLRVTNWPEMK